MNKKINRERRKILESRYKEFYKSKRCYYCGDLANTIDHIPAIMNVYISGADNMIRDGIKLITVSACRECNSLLSDLKLNTLDERVVFLYEKIQKRYKKYLRQLEWDEEEIEGLDGYLRDYVESCDNFKTFIERRLEYMEDLHYDII